MTDTFNVSTKFSPAADQLGRGSLITADDGSTNTTNFDAFQNLLQKSVAKGKLFTNTIVSTFNIPYNSTSTARSGSVLATNGDIHFAPGGGGPFGGTVIGQKLSVTGVVSTYNVLSNGYYGGVLAPNGDIHFVPSNASVGQKISVNGVVSTYALAYTTTDAYAGGVLAPNGDIHFVPASARVGQKVSAVGVVSTYALIYTGNDAYFGGVLAPNGDIHFVPYVASVGQKVSAAGVVSTYDIFTAGGYNGGVLAPNGDIHFVPYSAGKGTKVSASGVVSTYSFTNPPEQFNPYYKFRGGVLAPSGDIYFLPSDENTIGKLSYRDNRLSTFQLPYSNNTVRFNGGGVLDMSGNIVLLSTSVSGDGSFILRIPTLSSPFDSSICLSPYLNKF